MEKISPKKSLGQNFLVDRNISRKIIESFEIKSKDIIIEIGCGTGALTELILKSNPRFLISFDIDQRAVDAVKNSLSKTNYKNFDIIHSDIRTVNISDIIKKSELNADKVKVIGNIPYYISGDILFWIFEQSNLIEKAIIMMQKEVVQRLSAKPKTKTYGITTVAMNLIGECKTLFNVSPQCFYPVPKVTSTVVEIIPIENKYPNVDFDKLMVLVKAAFNQRRKMLRNALVSYINKDLNTLLATAPDWVVQMFSQRAEQLTTKDFISLFNYLNER